MVRSPFYDQNGVKKGAWSPEEDDKLRNYVRRYGCGNWGQLPELAGLNRCGKSCRLRWVNYLRPELKHGNFTQQENDLILQLHQQFGNKWSLIAAELPGRTDNEIKNHWNTNLRKLTETASFGSTKDHPAHFQTLDLSRSESAGSCADISADDLPHPILESSLLSPEISYAITSTSHYDSTDPGGPLEMRVPVCDDQTGCGDFWTEPFLVESNRYDFGRSPDLLMCEDEHVDLFYQLMQEFPNM